MQAVLLFLLSLWTLTLASPIPASNGTSPAELRKATDDDLFVLSLDDFITKRNAQDGPSGLDWTSDGCSYTLNDPLGFDFLKPCQRHDFGYRNYKKQGRFNATTKPLIDTNFRKDMISICVKRAHFVELCKDMAGLYYEGVRFLGSKREAAILKAQAQIQKAQAEALKVRDKAQAEAVKARDGVPKTPAEVSKTLAEILEAGDEAEDEARDEIRKARVAFRRALQNLDADGQDEEEYLPADSDRDGDFLEGEASEGKGYVSTDNEGAEMSDWEGEDRGIV